MYDIIIIGCGPAGMTAALYASRANKKVLVFEGKSYGGQILNASKVENYPGFDNISGFDLATNMYNQIITKGVEIKNEMVLKITKDKEVITSNGTYQAKAIILATGVQHRKLNITNETEYIGRGVSYCATCDGNFFRNKDVAVVGGGNTALEDALYLSDIVNKVYLIHRRDEFRGEDIYLDELKNKSNVEIITNSEVTHINGQELIKSIDVHTTTGENDMSKIIPISGLFVAVGQEPKNEIFADIIELDEKGYIKTNDGIHTNVEGIYVAGDCRNKPLRQLTTAVSDGSIAATIAIKEM